MRVIIPNLLHYDGPIITIDPKGENFAVTARYRRQVLGQEIYLLDPFEAVDDATLERVGVERAKLNPFDLIQSFGPHAEGDLTMMASLIASDAAQSEGDHRFWDQSAQMLLAGVIGASLDVARSKGEPHRFQSFIDMLFSDDVVYDLAVILDTVGKKSLSRFAYRAIADFLRRADKERSGVLSTAHSYLTPYISDALNNYLNTSSISPSLIADGDNYTIYIVIPPSKLLSHSILLRMWVATMLSAIVQRRTKPRKRTLFMLDECAQLGSLDELKKAITLMRGYGLQVWMFFQDYSQIRSLYPSDYATMVNNCGVFQTFGVPRNAAAILLAEAIGKDAPLDLVQLDRTQQIISLSTEDARILRLMNYLSDGLFAGRFDENPLFAGQHGGTKRGNPFPSNAAKMHY
ncbi:hypothetical protein GCM10022251_38110 [Phytohabitans flavus]